MVTVEPAVLRRPAALDHALAPDGAGRPVQDFLRDVAPGQVRTALRRCLPPHAAGTAAPPQLLRAKLVPGRKITAEYAVVLPGSGHERRIWVTWVAAGVPPPPRPAADAEAEARRRGVLAPFVSSWVTSDDGRTTVSVSPVDGAFPQLVRLHDRPHVAQVLRSIPRFAGVEPAGITVEALRYRPGQRHVLRVDLGLRGPALFAKVYRDDTGHRAVGTAARAAAAFATAPHRAAGVAAAVGTYVADDRVAFWDEVRGTALSSLVSSAGPSARPAVRAVGTALRLLHDTAPADGLPLRPDAEAQAGVTLRAAQVLGADASVAGVRLRRAVAAALARLGALPEEPPTFTHGDVKCDNMIVSGSGLHLLDFDRSGRGDPAADVGNFLADLRWWAGGSGQAATQQLQDAFLGGYGDAGPVRLARARGYEALFGLRMAARRHRIQDPGWAGRVITAVAAAAAPVDEGTTP